MKKIVTVVCGLSLLSLTACHTAHKPTSSENAGMQGESSTYATQNESDYKGGVHKDASGRVINSLTAPSDQTYYFDYDSNSVSASDYKALAIQANYLASHPNVKIRLEGNTDNRGSREYNIGLGWRRDQAVARMLEQQGVAPSQIDMVSYGKERPAAEGDNDQAWMLNRRVNLVYE